MMFIIYMIISYNYSLYCGEFWSWVVVGLVSIPFYRLYYTTHWKPHLWIHLWYGKCMYSWLYQVGVSLRYSRTFRLTGPLSYCALACKIACLLHQRCYFNTLWFVIYFHIDTWVSTCIHSILRWKESLCFHPSVWCQVHPHTHRRGMCGLPRIGVMMLIHGRSMSLCLHMTTRPLNWDGHACICWRSFGMPIHRTSMNICGSDWLMMIWMTLSGSRLLQKKMGTLWCCFTC